MSFYSGSCLLDLLGLITAIIVVGYAYVEWAFQYWKKRNVPYLEPVIPWGNLERPLMKTKSIGQEMTSLYKQAKEKGLKYCGIYIIGHPELLLIDLNIIKQVMTKDFSNFVDRGIYTNEKDDPLSGHLFALGGTKWRNIRVKLSPTFTSGKMKMMFGTLVDCGAILEKYVEHNVDNVEGLDIKEVLGKFSTDIIGSCAFGLECNSFKDPNSPFREYGRKLFEPSTFNLIKNAFIVSFPEFAKKLRMTVLPKDTSAFFMKVVEDTISYRRKNNLSRNDFLQLLMEITNNRDDTEDGLKGDGRNLTMDEAAAQCFVFFVAGFETSSTTMTFALYELAQHQDIQDRVRDEIKTVLAQHGNQVTYDSVNELKYMQQVIDETLRMYSPVPFINRQCVEEYKLPGEDMVIQKGTKVIIPVQGIHMDKEYYEDPETFDPERFSDENKRTRPQYAHIPFGEGPRICIGQRFGLMQSKVGLLSILKNFKVTLNNKTEIPVKLSPKSFIPVSASGIWLNLEKL